MCEKCKKTNAKVESVIKKVGAAELVEIMGLVVGYEDDASPIDRLFSVLKFSSMIDDPIEIVMLARHFGEAYLEEKERADKLKATLEMVSNRVRAKRGFYLVKPITASSAAKYCTGWWGKARSCSAGGYPKVIPI